MAELFMLFLFAQYQPQTPGKTGGLIEHLRSKDPSIRLTAVKELAKLGNKLPQAAIDPLIETLGDPDYVVRSYVIDALQNAAPSSDKAIGALIKTLESYRNNVTSGDAQVALIQIGKPTVKPIMEILKSGKMRSCHITIYRILAEMRTEAKEAIPVLEDGLKAKDADVRLFAARAIVHIDVANKSIERVLTAALKDSELRVRLVAAETLARSSFFKTKEALTVLLDILTDIKAPDNSNYRAAIALSYFGPAGEEALPVLAKQLEKSREVFPPFGVMVAGAIIKIDAKNRDARGYVESHREFFQNMARPSSDRDFREFAKDILENVLKKK
jgi:HEAT repeat protein